ncbi:DNA polymerase III subunit beta [Candidatus Nomurabacteria bacterium]|uniref:Beta sliding clamp n=1 Tax=candidate division WWE3 bacterium TaxID=2053526 RepID=A0A955E0P1_UNCKA|nr:DNA polymerase III subunit beta [candidate division WWE3 bacterium]MCB9823505.1 DNA polymerase III subunit beta [Candidatus Nomurabacteria bacterium]HXK52392.1 DNA polymerase III subunit beta [bacterium]
MKFTCLRENLAKSLSVVSKAIPIKSTFPILSNVLISTHNGRIKLSATNTSTSITTYVGASIEEEGTITIPAKMLAEFISNLSSETVSAVLENNVLQVNAGRTKSKFNGVPSDDFPPLPELKNEYLSMELDQKVFSNAVMQVGFSVALDDSRPVFTGIMMSYSDGKLTLVSTDGYRLSERIVSLEPVLAKESREFSVVIPAKTLVEVARTFASSEENIKVYVDEDESLCIFESGDTVISTRLLESSFPDYKAAIPQAGVVTANFASSDLLEAVKLTSVFVKGGSSGALKIAVDPETSLLSVSSAEAEFGHNDTSIPAEIQGESIELFFNFKYLLDFLNNIKYEKLTLVATGPDSACVLRSDEDSEFIYVMVPLQLNS